ncbi:MULTISPECIES: hypothetical protein [Actinomadura]|uniref:hypothetical protein n=1 Tax=Actinomadura TaxID=1988 RepID=UPI000400DA92|nr:MULTISPECIES: hypothetical protein [Actinomadura]RSN48552.1 hypothetical protein DMH08_33840 [Actinomadura sp. WAC 06369]
MRATLRRVARDVRWLRRLDAYAISALALVLAVLTVIGDVVSDDVRWAVALAALAALVYRGTLPDPSESAADTMLGDRGSLSDLDVAGRLRRARTVWLYAPSGVNFLTPERCEALRTGVLARRDGRVRIVVLDPERAEAVAMATWQLDDSRFFPLQYMGPSLRAVLDRLRAMRGWNVAGAFRYRLLAYNPGFSLLIIDPEAGDGLVIAELHGFGGESTATRMHVRITRDESERWFTFWVDQFRSVWRAARTETPEDGAPGGGAERADGAAGGGSRDADGPGEAAGVGGPAS